MKFWSIGMSVTATSMVRLRAVAIKMADNPIGASFAG
jgi:hypothetical protein